ncbi:hypothetical protein [Bradyrhizobium sp. JR3.5]
MLPALIVVMVMIVVVGMGVIVGNRSSFLLSLVKFSCVERYRKADAQASGKSERSGAAARCPCEVSMYLEEQANG